MVLDTYFVYLGVIAAFFATPPDTSQLLAISVSARHGLRRSAYCIAGDLSANCIQMTAAAFGLATMIAMSGNAFLWIKWIGVAYLLWLGLKLFLSSETADLTDANASGYSFRLFRQGFVTSMANPFAVVFFGALFPQFIDPSAPIFPQLVILGVTYLLVDGTILFIWGWLGVQSASVFKRNDFAWINKFCGMLMVTAAALLANKEIHTQR